MGRGRIVIGLLASVLVWLASAGAAQARVRSRAGAARHRVGHAWGIVPAAGIEIAVGPREPLVFHGGTVMHGVTVHTVFWAPAGSAFGGAPAPGVPGYEPLLQRFLTDAAARPGGVFSVLSQYGDGSRAGQRRSALCPGAGLDRRLRRRIRRWPTSVRLRAAW